MKKELFEAVKKECLGYYEKAHIVLTQTEKAALEVSDMGLGKIYETGLQLVTYVNTDLCCAKEMVLLPHQCCPEHIHAPLPGGYPGKEETFRCRYGRVYLFVEGTPCNAPGTLPPKGDEAYYTVKHQVILNPGEQYTIFPNTRHWFKAGDTGAVVSEFSTKSFDTLDLFTDPRVCRAPRVETE